MGPSFKIYVRSGTIQIMTLSLRPHDHTFHDKVQCALSEVYRATHARRWRGAPQRPLTRILTAETVNKRE